MKIAFAAPGKFKGGALAAAVFENGQLSASAKALDEASGGAIKRALKSSRFTGKKGQFLDIVSPNGVDASRLVLFGLGKEAELGDLDFERAGGGLHGRLAASGEADVTVYLDDLSNAKTTTQSAAAHVGLGLLLHSYRFDKYRTKEKPDKKPSLKSASVAVAKAANVRKQFAELKFIADGVFATRDLVSEPANVIYPESFAAEAKKLASLGLKVTVLGEKEMRKLGMGALLGVGQGSKRESQLVLLEWQGAKNKKSAPIAFVGKGVTFDTGGISIKPAAGMEDMKWDMGGAGVVFGLMHLLAARKAKVNAIGVCGLVENMPSGNAQRPGDIVTSMSGQTVEVINTDAEGRLVLADALTHVQREYAPRAIVDLATLTGAIIISLGNVHAGLFSNDDELSERLSAAGKAVGEPVWRMPLGEEYDRLIDCDAADMKNVGGRGGGSITAAQFLQRFVEDDRPWAHLDIAGVTWSSKDKPTVPKGATAFGVRLLNQLVAQHYED